MKLSKSIYRKIKLTMGVLAIAITATMLYFAISVNAFANEIKTDSSQSAETTLPENTEETTTSNVKDPANETVNLYFNYEGDCPAPNITILNTYAGTEQKYVIGEPFVVEKGAALDYSGTTLYLQSGDRYYAVNFETPIGYDFKKFDPEPQYGQTIIEDTTINAVYEKYDGKYSITGSCYKEGSDTPQEGINVCLYDNDFNPCSEVVKTDDNGKFTYNNIEADKAECYLMAWLEGYTNCTIKVTSTNYEVHNHVASFNLFFTTEDNATLSIQSKSEGHKYFDYNLKLIDESNPEIVLRENEAKWISLITDETDIVWFGDFILKENGALFVEHSLGGTYKFVQEITPNSMDGYTLDYWMIGNGSGEMVKYTPGLDAGFHIDESEKLIAQAYYKKGTTPDPEPQPTEDVNATAQTGDNSPLVPFVLLAVFAGGVLLYTRKLAKN